MVYLVAARPTFYSTNDCIKIEALKPVVSETLFVENDF